MSADGRLSWSTAVVDWEYRIEHQISLIPDLPLFEDVADRAVRVFSRLRVPDLPGTPTYGEVSAPWVIDFVRAIFGSFDPETRRRMIREFFLMIPKKNGKSAIAAAIIITAAILNERPRAELLLIAPTKTIAETAYKQAKGIIELDPELMKIFHVRDHIKRIDHRVTKAEIQIKAADTGAITGSKATFVLIDETHEFAKMSNAAAVFVEIRGGLASRPDGFLLQITTQSKEAPAGVFKAELDKARDVRDGKLALPILAVIYELPARLLKKDGWKHPDVWALVNPNLNISVDEQFLRDQLVAAEREGIAALALLASQHFNVEIGVGLRAQSWTGAAYWAGAVDPGGVTIDAIRERCDVAVVGIDGGGLDDLMGLAVVGREMVTRDYLVWSHAWCHPDVLQRRPEISPRLQDFAAAGDLTICEAATDDLLGAASIAADLLSWGLLPEKAAVGVDPFGVSALLDELALNGIADDMVVGIPQGVRLSPAIWGVERKLKDKTMRHGGQAMMDWVLGNAKQEQRGSAVLIDKAISGKAKIDPLIATLNGFTLMMRNPAAAPRHDLSSFLSSPVRVI